MKYHGKPKPNMLGSLIEILRESKKFKIMIPQTPNLKNFLPLSFHWPSKIFLAVFFTLALSFSAAQAKLKKINNIYFGSENSLVLESNEAPQFEAFKEKVSNSETTNYIIELDGIGLSRSVPKTLFNDKYNVKISEEKIYTGGFFGKKSKVLILISTAEKNLGFDENSLMEGQAYEILLIPRGPGEDAHKLYAQDNDIAYIGGVAKRTVSDSFIDSLDRQVIEGSLTSDEFTKSKAVKTDSANLVVIGDELAKNGHTDKALEAFRKAQALDPQNLNANLAIARHTEDKKEQLEQYIKTIKTEALVTVGDSWVDDGIAKSNPKTIASGLVSLQYAVLRDPLNPYLRFKYAAALEKAGIDHFEQAGKRFLEAAAIAKKQYLAGEKRIEPLLRKSIESLIKILAIQGDFLKASEYCKSYINLGYTHFLKGDPILAIEQEIKSNRNPFTI